MKTYRLLPLSCLVAVGCNRNPKDDGTTPTPLFPQPQTVGAKPEGGYVINPVTVDSIQPIILSSGDTLQTGVPILAKGELIYPDSVAKPQSFVVDHATLTSKNAHPNRHKVPKNIPTFSVDHSQLKTVKLGEENQDLVLVNSSGDTIPTGQGTGIGLSLSYDIVKAHGEELRVKIEKI